MTDKEFKAKFRLRKYTRAYIKAKKKELAKGKAMGGYIIEIGRHTYIVDRHGVNKTTE